MLRQLGLFFFIFSLSFSASAEPENIRYYDVEVLLFEHLGIKNKQSENWNSRRSSSENEEEQVIHELGQPFALDRKSPYDRDAMFTMLHDSQKQLQKEAELIEKSANRRVLAHFAWRQPGLAKDEAIWVHFNKHVKSNETSSQSTAVDFLTGEKKFTPYIDGKIKVMLARYLHVDTDILYFAEPSDIPETASNPRDESGDTNEITLNPAFSREPEVYLFNQLRRRIRSNELHYLDHPVMAMLLLITPYEKPEQATEALQKTTGQ